MYVEKLQEKISFDNISRTSDTISREKLEVGNILFRVSVCISREGLNSDIATPTDNLFKRLCKLLLRLLDCEPGFP